MGVIPWRASSPPGCSCIVGLPDPLRRQGSHKCCRQIGGLFREGWREKVAEESCTLPAWKRSEDELKATELWRIVHHYPQVLNLAEYEQKVLYRSPQGAEEHFWSVPYVRPYMEQLEQAQLPVNARLCALTQTKISIHAYIFLVVIAMIARLRLTHLR